MGDEYKYKRLVKTTFKSCGKPSLAAPASMRKHGVWGLTQASVVQEECN